MPIPTLAGGVDPGSNVQLVSSDLAVVAPPDATTARRSGPGRLIRNILLLAGGQLASWGFGLLWLVWVPRVLGPTPIGEFVVALAITSVLGNLINQGAGTLLTREIARDQGRSSALVAGAFLMRLACVLPAAVLMAAYVRLLHFGAEQTLIIWLATAVALIACLSGAIQAAFSGLERMEFLAYGNLVGNGLESLLGIGLVLLGGRIVALMELNLFLTSLLLALNLYWCRGLFRIAWRQGLALIPYIVRAGLSYWIGGLFFTTYLWIDAVLLSALAPANVVGWYGVPVQLFTAILMVAGVLGTAWFPRLAAAHLESSARLMEAGRPAVETGILLSLPIAAGLALVSGPLVQLLYGPRFFGAGPVLAVLACCVVPTFFNMLAYQVLLAAGRQVAWIKIVGVATVLNIVANLVLIQFFQARGNGALGSALSLLGTELLESVGALALLPWLLHRELLSRIARTVLATALMSIAVLAAAPFGIVTEIAVGMLAFAAFGLLLHLVTAEEVEVLRGFGIRARAKFGPGGIAA